MDKHLSKCNRGAFCLKTSPPQASPQYLRDGDSTLLGELLLSLLTRIRVTQVRVEILI